MLRRLFRRDANPSAARSPEPSAARSPEPSHLPRRPSLPTEELIPVAAAQPVYRQHVLPDKLDTLIEECLQDFFEENHGAVSIDNAERMRRVGTDLIQGLWASLDSAQTIKQLVGNWKEFLNRLGDEDKDIGSDLYFFMTRLTEQTFSKFMKTMESIAFENELRIERQVGPRTRYGTILPSEKPLDRDHVMTDFGIIYCRNVVRSYRFKQHYDNQRLAELVKEDTLKYKWLWHDKKPERYWFTCPKRSLPGSLRVELYGIYAARFGQYAEPFPNPNVPASDYAHTYEEFSAIRRALHNEERRKMDAHIARSMKNRQKRK